MLDKLSNTLQGIRELQEKKIRVFFSYSINPNHLIHLRIAGTKPQIKNLY